MKCFGIAAAQGNFNINPEELAENTSLETICMEKVRICDTLTGEEGNFGFLSNYPNLKELRFWDCGVKDIAFVSQFKNLERCHLEEGNITDYSPLAECKKLEYLCLGIDSSGERPDVAEEVEVEWGLHTYE